jgi:CRISPR/Cas system endoribonuclease Cas6 (RAMP superfamily)
MKVPQQKLKLELSHDAAIPLWNLYKETVISMAKIYYLNSMFTEALLTTEKDMKATYLINQQPNQYHWICFFIFLKCYTCTMVY